MFGDNGKFSFLKINQCPQFRAFCNETIRIAVPTNDGVGHVTDKDLRLIKYESKQSNKKYEIICDYADSNETNFNDIIANKNNVIINDYIIESDILIQPNMVYLQVGNDKIFSNKDNNYDIRKPNLKCWLKTSKDSKTGEIKHTFHNNPHSVPFSVGARDCAGQSLARKELQAFLANLILKYQISAPNNDTKNFDFDFPFGTITNEITPQVPVEISKR